MDMKSRLALIKERHNVLMGIEEEEKADFYENNLDNQQESDYNAEYEIDLDYILQHQ